MATVSGATDLTKLLDCDIRLTHRSVLLTKKADTEKHIGTITSSLLEDVPNTIICSLFLPAVPSEEKKKLGSLTVLLIEKKALEITQITTEGKENGFQKIKQILLQQVLLIRKVWNQVMEKPADLEIRVNERDDPLKAMTWSELGFQTRQTEAGQPMVIDGKTVMSMPDSEIQKLEKELVYVLKTFPNNPPSTPPTAETSPASPAAAPVAAAETPKPAKPPTHRTAESMQPNKDRRSFLQKVFDLGCFFCWTLPGRVLSYLGEFFKARLKIK